MKKFHAKSLLGKVLTSLKWIKIYEQKIIEILHGNDLVQVGDVDIENFPEGLLSDDYDIEILKYFMMNDVFTNLKNKVIEKKEANEYHCGICNKTSNESWVQCDSCLIWFHQRCVKNRFEDMNLIMIENMDFFLL